MQPSGEDYADLVRGLISLGVVMCFENGQTSTKTSLITEFVDGFMQDFTSCAATENRPPTTCLVRGEDAAPLRRHLSGHLSRFSKE
jgi:hypothetical protein